MGAGQPARTMSRARLTAALIVTGLSIAGWVVASFYGQFAHYCAAILPSIVTPFVWLRAWRDSLDEAEARAEQEIKAFRENGLPSKRIVKRSRGVAEEILWETREHPIVLLPVWLLTGGVTLAAISILVFTQQWPVALALWVMAATWATYKVYAWNYNRLAFSNTRLFAVQGVFTVTYPSKGMDQVTDESLVIPWHSMILARLRVIRTEYSILTLETAGEDEVLQQHFLLPMATVINRVIVGPLIIK